MMQTMTALSWGGFKSIVLTKKKLPIQFQETQNTYDIFAQDGLFLWGYTILKGTSDAADFETNYKEGANLPLELRGESGKPVRVATSSQPLNTVEAWKGFHAENPAGDATFIFDIWIGAPVYLKGGRLYSDDCTCEDFVTADIVLKENPSVILIPKIIDTVYLMPNALIPFMSDESMLLPAEAMIRATYTKKAGDTGARCLSALMDFFK